MHLDLLDLLRCPAGHEDTPLVSAVSRVEEREVITGTIGCPVCHRRFPVEDRILLLGPAPDDAATAIAADEEETVRLAALLDLVDPGGVVFAAAPWSEVAAAVTRLVPVQLLVADPLTAPPAGATVSAMRGGVRLPLAPRSLRAAALDARTLAEPFRSSVLLALRPKGRVVGPTGLPVPEGLVELARDARHWVAEAAVAASAPVALRRR